MPVTGYSRLNKLANSSVFQTEVLKLGKNPKDTQVNMFYVLSDSSIAISAGKTSAHLAHSRLLDTQLRKWRKCVEVPLGTEPRRISFLNVKSHLLRDLIDVFYV